MGKCEWKDGKYKPCKLAYNNYLDLGKPYGPFWNQEKQIFIDVSFCPWCGSDIRKPEEPNPDKTIVPNYFLERMQKAERIFGVNSEPYIESLSDSIKYLLRSK